MTTFSNSIALDLELIQSSSEKKKPTQQKETRQIYLWVDNLLSTFYFTCYTHCQVLSNSAVLFLSNRWKLNSDSVRYSQGFGYFECFQNKYTSFHSNKKKVLLTLIFNGLISISEVQFMGPSISYWTIYNSV